MATNAQYIPEQDDKILRRKQVEVLTGLPRSSIYDLIGKGKFPKPIAIGPRSVGWLLSELPLGDTNRLPNATGRGVRL